MTDSALTILYETNRFVAIDKPAGLLSVPGKGPDKQDCCAARVQAMFADATGPLTVHRLDMETSGVMVLALDADAHRHLSRQFEERTVEKEYVAILEGVIGTDEGVVDLPIRLDVENRPRQIVDHEQGKASETGYRVLERLGGGRTRVLFTPRTGRSHQLRVHSATPVEAGGLGAPIVGDSLYGSAAGEARMLLHASKLVISDPEDGERVEIVSEAPF